MPVASRAVALSLLILLAACGQAPNPPAAEAPPAKAPAHEPAARPASVSPSAAPLYGTWAADLGNCGSGAVTITADRFEGAENRCDITSLEQNGDGSFIASLSCTGEGQAVSERVGMVPVFAPTGEGVTLSYLDRGGDKVTLLRCD